VSIPNAIPPPRTPPRPPSVLDSIGTSDYAALAEVAHRPLIDHGAGLDATITALREVLADLEARRLHHDDAAALVPPVPDPDGQGPDVPVLDGVQPQGDVAVFPWPSFMSPHIRHAHVTAAVRLPAAGLVLLGSHRLRSGLGPPCRWADWPTDGLPSLGTLVVPPGAMCRMTHHPADPVHRHGELRIGPGVYAVRRQRRYVPAGGGLVFD
jgi:hypothetical protein